MTERETAPEDAVDENQDLPLNFARRHPFAVISAVIVALALMIYSGLSYGSAGPVFSEEILFQAAVHEVCHLASHGRVVKKMVESGKEIPTLEIVFPRIKPGSFGAHVEIKTLTLMVNAGYALDEPWYMEGLLAGDVGGRLFFENPSSASVKIDMENWENFARSYLAKGKDVLPWFNAPSNQQEVLLNADTLKQLRARQSENVGPFLKKNEALIREFARTVQANSGASNEDCMTFIKSLNYSE